MNARISIPRRQLRLAAAFVAAAVLGAGAAQEWTWRIPADLYQKLDIPQRTSVDRASGLHARGEESRRQNREADAVASFRSAVQEWKRFAIDCAGLRPAQKVLDLAGGTGDLTARFSRIVGERGEVVLADINDSMLKVGRDKLRNLGLVDNIRYVQANAEALPFPDNHFDLITIGFGLRNVTDKEKALASMFRVLKPGGRLLVLEFSKPTSELMAKLYDLYSFHILPKMGKLVARDSDSY